jgi:hypothetical protein
MMHDEDGAAARDYGNVFSGNTVTGCAKQGAMLSETVSGLRFERNTITGSGEAGILALGPVRKSAFVGNTIRDNAEQAVYATSASVWTDVVVQGNTVAGGLKLATAGRVAVLGNQLSGSAAWPQASRGSVVDIGAPSSSAGQRWTCSAAGAPGAWRRVGATIVADLAARRSLRLRPAMR